MTTTFVIALTAILMLPEDSTRDVSKGAELHLFFGFIVTAYLANITVSFLGRLYGEADRQQGTASEVSQGTGPGISDADESSKAVAEIIDNWHHYKDLTIHIEDDETVRFQLSDIMPEGVDGGTDEYLLESESIVCRTQESFDSTIPDDGGNWETVNPTRRQNAPAGVPLPGSEGPEEEVEHPEALGSALVGEDAVGTTAGYLHQDVEVGATGGRERIAQDMRDDLFQSFQALFLLTEACLSAARRKDSSLMEQLEELVEISKRISMEMRSYTIDLRPLFEGSGEITDILRNHAREFEITSGIIVNFNFNGQFMPMPDRQAIDLYEIFRHTLAIIRSDASASEVNIDLSESAERPLLTISENGTSFAPDRLFAERDLAALRGTIQNRQGVLEIETDKGSRNRISVTLILQDDENDLDPANDS